MEGGGFDRLADLVHEDIVVASKMRPGLVVEGKDEFVRFVRDNLAPNLHEATTTMFMPLDEQRVVVEGRLRWIDDDRVIRDDPVTWAMEFHEGLLIRFIPARTRIEAETILGASAS